MASDNFAAPPARGFSDRLQDYWDNPHPQGLVAMLKAALNGIGEAVQGSIDATTTPSTEQEAFWQNRCREQGPVGALKGATLLTPLAPGVGGAKLAAPGIDALRSGTSLPRSGPRAFQKGAAGASAAAPSFERQQSVPYIDEFLRYSNPSDHVAAAAEPANSANRFVSRNPAIATNGPAARATLGAQGSTLAIPQSGMGPLGMNSVEPAAGWTIPPPPGVWARPGPSSGPMSPSPILDFINRKRRKAALEVLRQHQTVKVKKDVSQKQDDDDGDDCYSRLNKEKDRCWERKEDYVYPESLNACLERANARRNLCVKNGGKPHPDEPTEWDLADEEIWRNYDR